jgi:ABC-type dipeptide/oligopeptide/nickel transport system ATPase component
MAFLLLQRGRFVLHASAVQVKASAIALAGASGSGKSSLAAALTRMGHGFIVDDVCALNMSASPVRIYPGFPQLKLSLEAAQVLDISPDELTPFEDQEVEQIYCLASNYHSPLDSLPLGGIYILNHQPENGLQHLEAREAVLELIRHSLPTRYHRPDDPSHFLQCVRLANEVPIYRLGRPASVTQLPELARQVEAHVLGEIRT